MKPGLRASTTPMFLRTHSGLHRSLRIFTALIALWSAMQVVFLLAALSNSQPSGTAQLMNAHHQVEYVLSLAFHSLAVILFGAVVSTPARIWQRLGFKFSNLAVAFYFAIALALLIIFVVSIFYPKYQIFVDLPTESVVKVETHLLPPGLSEQRIPFRGIRTVTGGFYKHTHLERSGLAGLATRDEYHYLVKLLTHDGSKIKVGRGFPPLPSASSPPEKAKGLARAIAGISGARLELRTQVAGTRR